MRQLVGPISNSANTSRFMRYSFVAIMLAACFARSTVVVAQAAEKYDTKKLMLFVWDADSQRVEMLDKATLPEMNWLASPEWSHDGTRIAFDATPEYGDWLRGKIALYHFSGPKKGTTEDLGLGDAPTWNTDDSRIAFFLNPNTGGGKEGTWTMKADGSDRKWLCDGWFPNWSPDGKYVVCTSSFADEHQLVLCEVATGRARPCAAKFSVFGQPAWSPDSKKLAALIVLEQKRSLVLIDVERDEIEQLLWHEKLVEGEKTPARISSVAWVPNRNELLVSLAAKNPQDCPWCVLGIGKLDRLKSDWRGAHRGPAWTTDGKQIVFFGNPLVKE